VNISSNAPTRRAWSIERIAHGRPERLDAASGSLQ
jgi:hypothetical protein